MTNLDEPRLGRLFQPSTPDRTYPGQIHVRRKEDDRSRCGALGQWNAQSHEELRDELEEHPRRLCGMICQDVWQSYQRRLANRVEIKLREAAFFLKKMPKGIAGGNTEKEELLDYYLSAFLSAARSVDNRLRRVYPSTYPSWRSTWNAAYPNEDALIKFFVDDRNEEVHEKGSHRYEQIDDIKMISGVPYTDEHTGTFTLSSGDMGPPPTLNQLVLYFTINGVDRKATDVCREYLDVLTAMVAKFKTEINDE